jgi:hypothetical protein
MMFPTLFLFCQTDSKIEKLPDFMQSGVIVFVKEDTLIRMSFCFDKLDNQIFSDRYKNLDNIKKCKVYEKKIHKNRISGFWVYEQFLKEDSISKIHSEYINIDNTTWFMKKYEDNLVVSENKVQVTDSIIGTEKRYSTDTIPTVLKFLKTVVKQNQ